MENVFDIKYKKQLEYVLESDVNKKNKIQTKSFFDDVVVLMYLYYTDTVYNFSDYVDQIESHIKVYVITPLEKVAEMVSIEASKKGWNNVEIIIKPNRGRDVSGLLIAAKSVISKYKYVCFIHDKKAHFKETEEDVALWIENMWENLLGSMDYVTNVINLFENDNQLGVLVPPAPVGKVFKVWYGYGWRGCYEGVKELATKLQLNCDLNEAKPPITIGTTLWFRSVALNKLFDYPWKYEDFDDEKLSCNNYLSYAIERIFAYVAQDAGFYTGEIMTVEYARKQTLFLQYSLSEIFRKMHPFYPFPTYENALCMDGNLQHMMQYVAGKKRVFIYGIDDIAKFCAGYLRKNGIEPEGFLITSEVKETRVDALPVYRVKDEIEKIHDAGIIISASNKRAQNEMIHILNEYGIEDYCIYLQEAR